MSKRIKVRPLSLSQAVDALNRQSLDEIEPFKTKPLHAHMNANSSAGSLGFDSPST